MLLPLLIQAGMFSAAAPALDSAPATGSGGGSRSFGYYPEISREIVAQKKKIDRKVNKRHEVERRMTFAKSQSELRGLLAQVNAIQKQIDVMVEKHQRIIEKVRASNQIIEDEAVLSLIL